MKSRRWQGALFSALLFVCLVIVGNMDYADERMTLDQYCENVKNKVWPDYKKIYKKECASIDKVKQRL